MFLTNSEREISSEYLNHGYIIRPVAELESLRWIQQQFIQLIKKSLGIDINLCPLDILNKIHQWVEISDLNSFRLKIIQEINAIPDFRLMYFQIAKPYLADLVGNELSMQLRINLSIQLPGDESSLLPIHADTWSGDSPYEVVVWLPLVDCYGTKGMYILPPGESIKLSEQLSRQAITNSEALYKSIENNINWLEVKYGEVLIFDQALPHGNRINEEPETRWSLNCRFKGVFTPYGDKKIGEFFEPITLRAASKNGMAYQPPKK